MAIKRLNKDLKILTNSTELTNRKDVYVYHDYRAFLVDEIAYQAKVQPGFSLRSLARIAGIAPGHLSMVLSGKKKLSAEKLSELARALTLKLAEKNHLLYLQAFNDSKSQQSRMRALSRLQRSISYQMKNRSEHHAYRYLSRWYYVVIREMASRPGFQADVDWIQARLQFPVSLLELRQALKFLVSNQYIKIQADGTAQASSENIYCMDNVYRIALSQFHKEMFELAIRSLDLVSGKERYLEGYTCGLSPSQFEQAQKIITQAIDEIEALEKHAAATPVEQNIYHFCFYGIPMLKKEKKKDAI